MSPSPPLPSMERRRPWLRFGEMALRYAESKERSAEVLRAALGCIGQYAACCNPITFAVWYEYATGMNTKLSLAIDECLRTQSVRLQPPLICSR